MGKISVIILTYNEEANIVQALQSVVGWSDEVILVDSFSTDRTVEIATDFGCRIVRNKFVNFSNQRNFPLDTLVISNEWIFFLDADEWVPDELKKEISSIISSQPVENGFYIKRRLIWMGSWIRRGYYPSWQLRLFRNGMGRCEDRAVNEHFIVNGIVGRLQNYFIDENHRDISDWILKHNDYATREAIELFNLRTIHGYKEIDVNFFGDQAQRKRWIRYKVWNRLPPLIRPFLYFFYRYIFVGGFLDGRNAFAFHFFQALWYPFLIDVKFLKLKSKQNFIVEQKD